MKEMDKEIKKAILRAQANEITEHFVYSKLSESAKDPHNKSILKRISDDELKHCDLWKKYTHQNVMPIKWKKWTYYLASKLLGITFGIKWMERGEEKAQVNYQNISRSVPEALHIAKDEYEHEKSLVDLIDEERLRYVDSMVLGLNDALVELTGALAGFTFALQNTRVVAVVGFITGIAASLSMAASEYLSIKSEQSSRSPFRAALYTGTLYALTVFFLVLPYLVFQDPYVCLGLTLLNAITVILLFTFYISVTKGVSFKKRFFEMAAISLGIAALTFGIGSFVGEISGLHP
jgi:VIT1/CCC1 family predicted Fe2+/Mn2+ transporter